MRSFLIAAVAFAATTPALGQSVVQPESNVGFPANWQNMTACTGLSSQPATCASSYYTSRYRLAWQEEFNFLNVGGDGASGRWFAAVHAPAVYGDWVAKYTDTAAYGVTSGQLNLATRWDGTGSSAHFVEGELQTIDRNGKGFLAQNFYAEVRVRGPQKSATHSGIWFLSQDNGATDATGGHTEIDMLEQYGPTDQYDHASSHIWPGSTGGAHIFASTGVARPEGKAVNWHTYGLLATDSAFTTFRDGVMMQTIARQPKQRVPLYAVISLYPNPPVGTPTASSIQVDYMRFYLPN
jgi:hypothetical protein